ncbi:MAG: hypothetical protein ACE5E0_04985, partial [Terriglobia bacterium]
PHHVRLLLQASNGRQAGELEIYANVEDLIKCADALSAFPRYKEDVFLWELGSERPEDRCAFYFRLRAFVTNKRGHCAINIRLNNNEGLPETEISEFCIPAEPSQINRLGRLFRDFAKLQHETLFWGISEGRLLKSGSGE